MTRFARARGSKASNEKAPEDGTPWEIMKEQLEKAKKETEESKKRQEAENKRIDNYEKFLKEQKTQKRKATWCDFPEVQQKKKTVDTNASKPQNKSEGTEIKNPKSKKKKQKNKGVKETATDASTIDETKTKNKMPKEIKENSNETSVVLPKSNDTTHLEPKENKKKKTNKKVEQKNMKEASSSVTVPQQPNKIEEKTHHQQNRSPKENPKKNAPHKNIKKKLMDGQPNRRKPVDDGHFQLMINGKDVKLVRFDGFPIMERDAERIGELRQSMLKKGIPKSEIQRTIKLERRRAEKALARMKKDVCYNCRKGGHNLSDCPDLKSKIPGVDAAADGMCFKCGSTEHRQFECKVQRDKEFRFATCFICKEPGHIARQCPDNPKGLYPNGGACKLCGDVTHLRKDCPTVMDKKEEKSIKLSTLDNMDSLEDIEQNTQQNKVSQEGTKKPKKIKF